MDWFLYDNDLLHERVKVRHFLIFISIIIHMLLYIISNFAARSFFQYYEVVFLNTVVNQLSSNIVT